MKRDTQQPVTVSLSDDRTLAYTEYGSPDGTPVLFFHGTPGSRRFAQLFETTAKSHNIRLLAYDRPGYGLSSPWPERTVRETARSVTSVLDDAGIDTAGVIAFSGGAPYAFASAATLPERIDRLDIVSGATPPHVTDEQPFVQQLLGGMATKNPGCSGRRSAPKRGLCDTRIRRSSSVSIPRATQPTLSPSTLPKWYVRISLKCLEVTEAVQYSNSVTRRMVGTSSLTTSTSSRGYRTALRTRTFR